MKKQFFLTTILLITVCFMSCQKLTIEDQSESQTIKPDASFRTSVPSIVQWQKCFGSSGTEDGYAIAVAINASNPGYFSAGSTDGNNGNVAGNHGGNDAWLIKTGLDGSLEWQIAIGGTGNDYGKGVVATNDGGCLMAIEARSSDGDAIGLDIRGGLLLVKVSNTGTIVWKQGYGGSGSDVPHAMIKTSDGGVAITGYTLSQDLEGAPLVGTKSNVWLLKLNPVIDPLNPTLDQPYTVTLQKTFGLAVGSNGESAYSIVETSGDYTMAGVTYTVVNGSTTSDIWVVKANAVGNQLWTKAFTNGVSFGITSSPDGGVVITGFKAGVNLVAIKLNASGEQVWQTTYLGGNVGGNRGQAIISTNQGYIITGSTNSNKGDILTTNGGEDIIIVKLNTDGSKAGNYSFGGTGNERGRSIIPSADGLSYIALGYTTSNNGVVSGNHGGRDLWLLNIRF